MNSQNICDTWSLIHYGSGVVTSGFFKFSVPWAVVIHQLWEIGENSETMLKIAESMTKSYPIISKMMQWDTYTGDSPTNTASDTWFFMMGALTAETCQSSY